MPDPISETAAAHASSSAHPQEATDREHLRLLRIFHFVLAGLTGGFLLLLLAHFALMSAIFLSASRQDDGAPLIAFIVFFVVLYGAGFLFLITIAVLNLLAGRMLGLMRHRIFCLVVAAFDCLLLPFGTILGVFTIVVLARPSVIALFEARAPAPVNTTPPAAP